MTGDLSAWYPDVRQGERTMLEQFLDLNRAVVVDTVADLDDGRASVRLLAASDLTIGGVVKHLAHVEDRWFQLKLLGAELPEPWASAPFAADPDWACRTGATDPISEVVELYTAACRRSRAAAARFATLDATAASPSFGKGPVSLRWILVHMIEETARHAGHLDLLRDATAC